MADWIDDEGFRANVGIVLMRDDGRVLLGGRSGGKGWQFPQGGIQRSEPFRDALYRELEEETGLMPQDVELLGETRGWLRYRLPRQYRRRSSIPLCIGQKQRWALLRFNGADHRIRFDSTDQPPEFEQFRWADYWEPVREVVYFKREVYKSWARLHSPPACRRIRVGGSIRQLNRYTRSQRATVWSKASV